ncbi:MAG: nicotinate (nicotinamide) nucleotide adenylyltransferase [Eubacterium sp.]
MARIGIFGGAFNPVHNGHLSLAENYLDALSLNKVLFIPTSVPPHKTAEYLVSGKDRINMLKSAIAGNDNFEMTDIEFKREGKSYTFDTITQLKKIYQDDELFLIVGSDQFFSFNNWYRADDILSMVTVVTAAREDNEYKALLDYKMNNKNMKNTIVSNFGVVEVSSSEIREKIKKGADISDLVPISVAYYIKENKLYV